MNELDALFAGQRDDALYVQIGGYRTLVLADLVSLVRLETMDPEAVLVRIDGDGAHVQFGGASEDAHGDFTTVSGEQFFHRNDTGIWKAVLMEVIWMDYASGSSEVTGGVPSSPHKLRETPDSKAAAMIDCKAMALTNVIPEIRVNDAHFNNQRIKTKVL